MEGPGEWVHIEKRGLSPGGEGGSSEAGLEESSQRQHEGCEGRGLEEPPAVSSVPAGRAGGSHRVSYHCQVRRETPGCGGSRRGRERRR